MGHDMFYCLSVLFVLIVYAVCVCVCVCVCTLSHIRLFATPWTIAHQAPLSMGFSRKEYWRGLLSPPPRDLPNPGIEPMSLASPALALDH